MKHKIGLAGLLGVLFVLGMLGTGWGDDVPGIINYQGKLLNDQGNAVTNGSYVVGFRIWNDISITNAPNLLWGRRYPVYVVNGMFSVLLGEGGQALTPAPVYTNIVTAFGAGTVCYLGLTIESAPTGPVSSPVEIQPRQRLVSAPYALTAANAADLLGAVQNDTVNNRMGIGTAPATVLDVQGPGTTTGSYAGAANVVGRFRNTTAGRPSAISVDALAGQESQVCFARNGSAFAGIGGDVNSNLVFWVQGDKTVRYQWISSNGVSANGYYLRRYTGGDDSGSLLVTEPGDGSSTLQLQAGNDDDDKIKIASEKGSIEIANAVETASTEQDISLSSVDNIQIKATNRVILSGKDATEIKAPVQAFGAMATRDLETTYTADTDGFLLVYAYNCQVQMNVAGVTFELETDATDCSNDNMMGCVPVARGESYQVHKVENDSSYICTIRWCPFGRP